AALATGTSPAFSAALSDKKTIVLNSDSIIEAGPEKDTLTQTWPHRLRQPVWLVSITVGIILLALAWWGSNIFRQSAPQETPTQVVAAVAATPTPTNTPTVSPSPTLTDTPQPPT